MRIISHRANILGPNSVRENHPDEILQRLAEGYDVEIDVRYIDDKYVLGHDVGLYDVRKNFLKDDRLWVHAKCINTLYHLIEDGCVNAFYHTNEDVVLTTSGYLWTFPGNMLTPKSICVLPEISNAKQKMLLDKLCYAVCTDYVKNYIKE